MAIEAFITGGTNADATAEEVTTERRIRMRSYVEKVPEDDDDDVLGGAVLSYEL